VSIPSPLTILRLAGLAAWAVIGVETFAEPSSSLPGVPASGSRALEIALYLVFGLAFWWTMRRVQDASPTRASVGLLLLQVPVALLVSADLLVILAIEVPLILTGRAVALWMGTQVAVTIGLGIAISSREGFMSAALSRLPHALGVTLTILEFVALEALTFAVAYLGASQFRDAQQLARGHRELARINAELRATQALLADSSRLAERLHISRELHDAVGHHLVALSLNLELAGLRASGSAAEPVQEAHAVARLLLADVRSMVSTLREDRTIDLRHALETLVAGVAEPRIHLTLPEGLDVAPSQAHAVFRCVQEAITNAIRHADAQTVWIDVTRDQDRLEVRVRDDGRGASDLTPGNGLAGMRERLEEIGGQLEVQSEPGGGLRLRAWLPLAGEAS
jgi:signal transduction histidine kinase